MIHIIFVPGMFGSAVEFALRSHTVEGDNPAGNIKADGSMHSFLKQFHSAWSTKPETLSADIWITTPIYPEYNMYLPEIVNKMQKYSTTWKSDKKVLIYAIDRKWAEINLLFQYYKIAVGLKKDLDIFFSGLNTDNVKQWNPLYQTFKDLKPWELREWLSLCYPDWIQKWIDSPAYVDDDFLLISNKEIIENTEYSFSKIIDFCGLTRANSLSQFVIEYQSAQKYVLDEYKIIENIVQYSIDNQHYCWDDLNIVSEAIVQQQLRAHNFEIRCNGLDIFPTDAVTLHKLLDKQRIH